MGKKSNSKLKQTMKNIDGVDVEIRCTTCGSTDFKKMTYVETCTQYWSVEPTQNGIRLLSIHDSYPNDGELICMLDESVIPLNSVDFI